MSDLKPKDYTLDENGLVVLSAGYLLSRGYCCESGCRNCPYGFGDKRFQVLPIKAEQTLDLRKRVLRPHQPIEKCNYAGDHLAGSAHFGAYQAEIIVGIVSVAPELSPLFDGDNQYRMRGMAIDPEFRRHRLATRLVAAVEMFLTQRKASLLWFNAREVAFPFYESLGYEYASDRFEIEDIGPHRVMYKLFRPVARSDKKVK